MKSKKLAHYFLPHPKTHKKAHLLSWHYLIIYILLFILVRVGIDVVSVFKPGVLGVSSNITVQEIIVQTNNERIKKGLPILKENQALDAAAVLKAQNMFEENYWAHFSPSGKDPWGFIKRVGYSFNYAGENLARNFYTSDDVVKAWMNSPSHRDNLLNSKYEDIGIAVVEGVLQGQKTTLIVQMFGKSSENITASSGTGFGIPRIPLLNANQQSLALGAEKISYQAAVDPFILLRIAGGILIAFVALLLLLDFVVLKRRGVLRISSHHLAHLSLLAVAGASLILTRAGDIL